MATESERAGMQITKTRGRPKKNFEETANKTKNRRVSYLIENYSLEELKFAVKKRKIKFCFRKPENKSKKLISSKNGDTIYGFRPFRKKVPNSPSGNQRTASK